MTKQKAQKVMLMDLPIEILADMLSRLSVNNIVACQLVCKNWNKLINQSYFKDMYLRRVLSRPRRIMLYDWEINEPFWINLEVNNDSHTVCAKKEDILLENDVEKFCLKAFSNGMFFMAGLNRQVYSTIRMCNPLTEDCIELPNSNLRMQNGGTFGYGFGFGFDDVNNKYKVFRVFVSGSGSDCCTKGEILTLGENLWRPLKFPCSIRKTSPRPVFSNGEFYWLIKKKSNPSCLERVLIFDIVSETFETAIWFPEYLEQSLYVELINFGESAALMERCTFDTDLFQVWRIVGNRTQGRRLHLCTYDVSDLYRQFQDQVHFVAMLTDGTLVCKGSSWISDHHECDPGCFHIALYFPLTKTSLVIADEPIYIWASVAVPSLVNPSKLLC